MCRRDVLPPHRKTCCSARDLKWTETESVITDTGITDTGQMVLLHVWRKANPKQRNAGMLYTLKPRYACQDAFLPDGTMNMSSAARAQGKGK